MAEEAQGADVIIRPPLPVPLNEWGVVGVRAANDACHTCRADQKVFCRVTALPVHHFEVVGLELVGEAGRSAQQAMLQVTQLLQQLSVSSWEQ